MKNKQNIETAKITKINVENTKYQKTHLATQI